MFTPGASGVRKGVEQRSAAPMAFLYQLPRWALPIALTALLIAGLAVSGVIGAVVILVLTAFLGWLAYLSWPSIGAQARVLRVAAAVVLIGLAVLQFVL
jgi:hypothetical protein